MKDFSALAAKAHEAGMAAGSGKNAGGSTVGIKDMSTGKVYELDEFPCGFGYVTVRGGTAFAKWALAQPGSEATGGHWSKGYPKGVSLFVWPFNQSMNRKGAYARAYADVLNAAGIEARAHTVID